MGVVTQDTVKGSYYQGDIRYFSANSIGHQCMANAVAGAIYATMLPVYLWTPATLDRILMAGDTLYLQRCDSHYHYLQLSDIEQKGPAQMFEDQYILYCDNPKTGLIDQDIPLRGPFYTLTQALSTMENVQLLKYGILTVADDSNGASVLICVKQGNYFIFDSHSRDRYGNIIESGTSVLLHFKSKDAIVKYIENIAHQLCASQFEITPLAPLSLGVHRMLQTSKTTKPSQKSNVQESSKITGEVDSSKSKVDRKSQILNTKVQGQTRCNKKNENKNVNVPQIGKRKSERILSKNSSQNRVESNEQIKKLKMKQVSEFNDEKHNRLENLLKRKLEISTNDDNIEKKKRKKDSQKKSTQTEHRYNTHNRCTEISKDRDGKKMNCQKKVNMLMENKKDYYK